MPELYMPEIKITNSRGEIVDLSNFAFRNFKYTEDINGGFPMIEFSLEDNMYQLLKERLYGDEVLELVDFREGNFLIPPNKKFKIKTIGSLGLTPKISSVQGIKLLAIDEVYDNMLKSSQSVWFEKGEKKIISDLLAKFLNKNNIYASQDFEISIPVPTKPLPEYGFNNLYIPYTRDIMKVIKKLANYSVTADGRGGYIFYVNRYGIYFLPIYKLFESNAAQNYQFHKEDDSFPYLRITEENTLYQLKSVKLSTYNSFANFITGGRKLIYGFNNTEKDYNIVEYEVDAKYKTYDKYIKSNFITSQVKIDNSRIPFPEAFKDGNITSYYTPLDNVDSLKAFGDTLYYSQMFNYNLDVEMNGLGTIHNFKIGDVINVEFFTTNEDKWEALNGGWLLKSFEFLYPGNNISLKLTRMATGSGLGQLPETSYTIIG
jgi:hypothetical protein